MKATDKTTVSALNLATSKVKETANNKIARARAERDFDLALIKALRKMVRALNLSEPAKGRLLSTARKEYAALYESAFGTACLLSNKEKEQSIFSVISKYGIHEGCFADLINYLK